MSTNSATSLDRRTLTQQIEDILTELLVDGRFAPGEKLSIDRLCGEYGFTRTPLREALWSLASQGLLDYGPNQGYRVRRIGREKLLEIYAVREVLEGLAAGLAASRVTDEQIAELQELAETARAIPATAESARADWEFHGRIAQWSGNEFVGEVLSAPHILARTMLFSHTPKLVIPPPGPHTDHQLVVRAIATRDPAHAEAAMRAHLRDAAERSLAAMRAQAELETQSPEGGDAGERRSRPEATTGLRFGGSAPHRRLI